MNAHTLRKWSPIKLLMYLWLPIYILLIIWCQGAFTMHLTSHNNHKSSLFQTSQEPSYYSSSLSTSSSTTAQSSKLPSSVKTTRAIDQTTPSSPSTLSYSAFTKSHYSDSFERQIKDHTTNWVTKDTSISLLNTTTKTIGTTTITRTTGPYNQIPEQRTYFDTNSNRSNERERGGKIILSYSFDNNNNNNNSSSNRTRSKNSGNHFDDDSNILDYEESHLQKIWQSRLREKRARIMAHRRQRQILKHLTNHKYIDNVKPGTAGDEDNDNDDDDDDDDDGEHEETAAEEMEEVVEGITIDNGKHRSDSLIGNNNYNLNNNQNNGNNNKNKDLNNININNNKNNLTTFNIKNNDNVKNNVHHHHHHHSLLNSGALSVASRNRRESRNHFTVQQHMPHQQQQQPTNHRQRQRRYCSARDPRTLSFESPTVFEGKIKSMSSDRRTNFSVTFEIIKIYKKPQSQKLPQNVRLQFSYRNYSECDIYREEFRQRGFVRDELEQGKIYFLFVKQMSLGNFSILGQPIKKAKRVVNDVLLGVSENYGKRASIESLTYNVTVKEGKRVRLVCKVNGQPAPKVTWFKDGRSINRNRLKYSFVHLRRRSELIIKSAVRNDTGRYECRAKNKLAPKPVLNFTRIEVLPKDYTPTKQPNGWKSTGSNCPSEGGDLFCLNGGTCVFFKDVGEPACNCPDGFIGNRCETKNPTNIQPKTTFPDPFMKNGHLPYPGNFGSDYDDDGREILEDLREPYLD